MDKHKILLTGTQLTEEQVVKISREYHRIEISSQALTKVIHAHELIEQFAMSKKPIYGLNRGVGGNKDQQISLHQMEAFNHGVLLSHCVSTGSPMSEEEVRAMMVIRLNTWLLGTTGISPDMVFLVRDFLNYGIHPIGFKQGSVGMADLPNLAQLGLALIGEGEVLFLGEQMPTQQALQTTGLQAVDLGPKDALSIISSNSYSAGKAAIVLDDLARFMDIADIIYALSLEAFAGNVSVLDERVNRIRPFRGQNVTAKKVRDYLVGSYLWNPKESSTIQDPLSFRSVCHVHGSVRDAFHYVKELLLIQLNSPDDNPVLLLEDGEIEPSANFEVTTWVLGFEMLGIALSHLSKLSCYRTMKLGNPSFTQLSRFLVSGTGSMHGFGTIQKTSMALDAEIRHLSNPASNDFFSMASDMEDHSTHAPYVIEKIQKMLDNLYCILGIEAIHAAQAIDLRDGVQLGIGTQKMYEVIREQIPFLDQDRNLSVDIKRISKQIKETSVKQILNHANSCSSQIPTIP